MLELAHGLRGRLCAAFGPTRADVTAATSPLELRGPFGDGAVSRFYLRNVSCGIFAGDEYDVELRARDGARVWVSGSSATSVHAMHSGWAVSSVRMEAETGSRIAFVDGPTILHEGADFSHRVEVTTRGGLAIYTEILVFGRLARGEALAFSSYRSELAVRDMDGRDLYVERYHLDPCADRSTISVAARPVLGSVVLAGLVDDASLARLDWSSAGCMAGYDELPSGAGFIVSVAGDRLEPVVGVVEEALRRTLEA